MNKFKFLSSAVMAAFFAFGLASCEKENFSTKTEVDVNTPTINIPGVDLPGEYKPGDAVISIQPTVWAILDGELQNVTAASTLTFNDEAMKTYTKTSADGFAAMTIKITATYVATLGEEEKTLTAETTVEVPALNAGQVAIFTPTLVMSAKSPEQGGDEPGGDEPGGDEPGGDEPGGTTPGGSTYGPYLELINQNTNDPVNYHCDVTNKLNYWFPAMTVTTDMKFYQGGTYVENENIINQNYATQANQEINKFKTATEAPITFYEVTVYANSVTCIEFSVTTTKKNYAYKEGTSRAAGDNIATFTVCDNAIIIGNTTYGIALPDSGHGHGHGSVGHNHGHGNAHDHGHGNDNAGGGIVSAL